MYKKQIVFFISIIMLFSAFFFGCDQDKFDAGIDLVPDSLKLETSAADEFKVTAYTKPVESILTSFSSKVFLGHYQDEIFGDVTASFVTEIVPSTIKKHNDSIIKEDVVLDSLVLYFRYDTDSIQTYGSNSEIVLRNTINTFNISRINKFFTNRDSVYSNFDVSLLNAEKINTDELVINPSDIIDDAEKAAEAIYAAEKKEEDDKAADEGRQPDYSKITKPEPLALVSIKLPMDDVAEIHQHLINSITANATFVENYNGYLISPVVDDVTKNNCISIFDFTDTETKAVLYYRTEHDTLEYDFNLSTATRFNIFEHDFSKGNLLPYQNGFADEEDTVVYLQGFAGLKTKIQFPEIDKIKEEGLWAVNKAELILPVELSAAYTNPKNYRLPEELILLGISKDDNNNEVEFALTEYTGKTGNYTGALLYEENQYRFDITLYMQKLFKGDIDNNGLYLRLMNAQNDPSRVVLKSGRKENSSKMKLALTLTKLSD